MNDLITKALDATKKLLTGHYGRAGCERLKAIQEGHRNDAEDRYFSARPEKDSDFTRVIFRHAFDRGYDCIGRPSATLESTAQTEPAQQEPTDIDRDAQEMPFEAWWNTRGYFLRVGGEQYKKDFAWDAWCTSASQQPAQRKPTDKQMEGGAA